MIGKAEQRKNVRKTRSSAELWLTSLSNLFLLFLRAFVCQCIYHKGDGKQKPASRGKDLHVGTISCHRPDSLNTSNDLFNK